MCFKTGAMLRVMRGMHAGMLRQITMLLCSAAMLVVVRINKLCCHQCPNKQHPLRGIIDMLPPIHVSNELLLDPATNCPTRIGSVLMHGNMLRIACCSGTAIDK